MVDYSILRLSGSSSPSAVRHVCEVAIGVVIVAVTLRTWLMTGLIVPITVSAGSMAESLLGPHVQIDCRRCGFSFACGNERLPRDGFAVCPNCGEMRNDLSRAVAHGGDQVFINRAAYLFHRPERWDVVVFRCPQRARQYCVKRIAGLPGETIQIRDGDVYVDGEISRKRLPQQRAMALFVYDDAYRSSSTVPRWRGETASSRWTLNDDGYTYSAPSTPSSAQSFDWLVYHHLADEPVRDDYSYNQSESRRLNGVSDLMLSCQLAANPGSEVSFRVTDGREWFELTLAGDGSPVQLQRNGKILPPSVASGPDFSKQREMFVELSTFDRQLLLAINCRATLVYEYEPASLMRESSSRPLAIGAKGRVVRLRMLKLWRDVTYTDSNSRGSPRGTTQPLRLADDEFYVLGDNSPISADSRQEPRGIPYKLFVGKPLAVH